MQSITHDGLRWYWCSEHEHWLLSVSSVITWAQAHHWSQVRERINYTREQSMLAMQRGTRVHKAIEERCWPIELREYCVQWELAKRLASIPDDYGAELVVADCEREYAGRLDIYWVSENRSYLGEIKTGKSTKPKAIGLQLGAYAQAGPFVNPGGLGVSITPDWHRVVAYSPEDLHYWAYRFNELRQASKVVLTPPSERKVPT